MLVEPANIGVAEQHAAATVGLQAMLVRVDHDRIHVGQAVIGSACVFAEHAGKPEVTTVCRVGMDPRAMLRRKFENLGQRVDSPQAGIADCRDNRADVAAQ